MYSIDRFEGAYAVIDANGARLEVLRQALPPDAREGDVLRRSGHAWIVDSAATQRRRQMLRERRNRLNKE